MGVAEKVCGAQSTQGRGDFGVEIGKTMGVIARL